MQSNRLVSAKLKRRLQDHGRRRSADAAFVERLLEMTRKIELDFEGDERSRLLRMAEETLERHVELRDHTALARESLDQLRADQNRLVRILEGLRARPEDETIH